MDSDGMLSMLVCASSLDAEGPTEKHWEWMPMLDTVGLRKSRDDSFWPVTVYDGKLVCVPLKGGMKHPDAVRRPVTAALGFRLPLARGPLTKTHTLEELAVRAAIALGQKKAIHEISREGDEDDEDFEKEYRSLSAQVVRYHRFCGCLCECRARVCRGRGHPRYTDCPSLISFVRCALAISTGQGHAKNVCSNRGSR
jgi:hypothetical protein